MAFSKNITTDYGVDATYWRIAGTQTYYEDECVDVTLFGYATKKARTDARKPISSISGIRLTWDEMGLKPDQEPTRTAIYKAIKKKIDSQHEEIALLHDAKDV